MISEQPEHNSKKLAAFLEKMRGTPPATHLCSNNKNDGFYTLAKIFFQVYIIYNYIKQPKQIFGVY